MITLENITFAYKKKEVLNINNLIIEDGQKIALMGLNGAGKTTLAELLIGLNNGYKGKVIKDRKYRFNAVFQSQAFLSEINLKQLFYLYCDLYKVKKDHQPYFEAFDIADVQNQSYKKISGGQQQKFKFLIALLNEPDFLLLDEISTGLDYLWRTKIIDLIKIQLDKQPQQILLLISHNPEEIVELCNRVILLEKGKIVQDFNLVGTKKEKRKILESLVKKDA